MAKRATQRRYAIVLGVDFSRGSQIAERRAVELARRYDAALHVVHAEPRIPRALARRFSSVGGGKPREELEAVVEALRGRGINAHAHLMQGEPVKCLTTKARAVAADLVVVGTRGTSVISAVIGSTAERLVAVDQHRVLLVRRSAERAYRKVVIAAGEESRLREEMAAAEFVSTKPVTVLHVYEAPFESALISHGASARELSNYRGDARRQAEHRMSELLTKAGIDPAVLVLQHGNPFRVLERFDPDSLLVLSRSPSRARRLLLGSVTRAVVAYGRSDLLLV